MSNTGSKSHTRNEQQTGAAEITRNPRLDMSSAVRVGDADLINLQEAWDLKQRKKDSKSKSERVSPNRIEDRDEQDASTVEIGRNVEPKPASPIKKAVAAQIGSPPRGSIPRPEETNAQRRNRMEVIKEYCRRVVGYARFAILTSTATYYLSMGALGFIYFFLARDLLMTRNIFESFEAIFNHCISATGPTCTKLITNFIFPYRFKFSDSAQNGDQVASTSFFSNPTGQQVNNVDSKAGFFSTSQENSRLAESTILFATGNNDNRDNQGSSTSFFREWGNGNARQDQGNPISRFFGGQNVRESTKNHRSSIFGEERPSDRDGRMSDRDGERGSNFFAGNNRSQENRSSFFGGGQNENKTSVFAENRSGREQNNHGSSSFLGGGGQQSGNTSSFFGGQGGGKHNRFSFFGGDNSPTGGNRRSEGGGFFGGGSNLTSREPEVNQHGNQIKRINRGARQKNFLNSKLYG